MRVPTVLLIALALPLAGCLQTRTESLGVDHYRLLMPYKTRDELAAAVAHHERKAVEFCPDGYSKRKNYDRIDGSTRILVWEIGCNKQYRPDNSKSKQRSG